MTWDQTLAHAMAKTDWAVVWATLAGPVVAVAMTLWAQDRSQRRDRQETVLRQLLLTHLTPADPAFTLAINMIPLEFKGNSKVMGKHGAFVFQTGLEHPTMNTTALKNELLVEVMNALGYATTPTTVMQNVYQNRFLAENQQLGQDVLKAILRVADALEHNGRLTEQMLKNMSPPPLETETDPST